MTTSPELFELKVLVEADDWRDVAALMTSVDRALDPHHTAVSGDRRWSVVANRLPAERAHELLEFLGRGSAEAPARGSRDAKFLARKHSTSRSERSDEDVERPRDD